MVPGTTFTVAHNSGYTTGATVPAGYSWQHVCWCCGQPVERSYNVERAERKAAPPANRHERRKLAAQRR